MSASTGRSGVRSALRLTLWATLVLALLAPQVYSVAAHAGTVSSQSASDTCWLGASDCGPTYAPPALLGPDAYAAMTPAQAASLHAMEKQAVTETLTLHGLPTTDRDAVATWARPSAQAALFALVTDAVRMPEAERTQDQQNAVEWMAGLARRHTEDAANHAGAEYARWAGLNMSSYWRLVDHRADQAALTSFLSTTPEAYSEPDTAQATGGYCKYHPPAPHEEEYLGRGVQTCYTHCSSITCLAPQAPTPSYDSLVSWGEAAATHPVLSNSAYQLSAVEIATEVTFILTRTVVLASTVVGTVASVILDFPLLAAAVLPASLFELVSVVGTVTTTTVSDLLPSVVSALEAAVTGAAMVSSVMIVMAAITSAVLVGIKVNDDAELPGKLASLVVGARADSDPAALLGTSDGTTTLYSLFVQATLPLPRADLHCANDDAQVAAVCLNAGPVATPDPRDPTFLVRDYDSKPGQPVEQVSPTITLPGPGDVASTVRVAGNWFVQSVVDGSKTVEAQSLGLGYTDWTGEQTKLTWLARDAQGQYSFVGVAPSAAGGLDPATCVADKTCWKASFIRFRGADGHRYEAHIEPYRPPVGMPTYSAHPVEGSAVAFDAHGFAPAGAVGPLYYGWQFQRAGCGVPCTTATGPTYSGFDAGENVANVWQTSGQYQVRLEVRDKEGRSAVTTMTVPVGGVPPMLTADTDSAVGAPGQPVTLTGQIEYAGTFDNQHVTIRWGDGGVDLAGYGVNELALVGNPLQITQARAKAASLTATHTYAAPGTYPVTVTTTNQAGQSDTQKLTYTVTEAP